MKLFWAFVKLIFAYHSTALQGRNIASYERVVTLNMLNTCNILDVEWR